MENAKKFIDFLLSQEIQDKLGTETTIRPIRKNARTNKNMKAMTEINIALKIPIMSLKTNLLFLKSTMIFLQISNLNSKRGSL